jgi:FkbM family methyltransferase
MANGERLSEGGMESVSEGIGLAGVYGVARSLLIYYGPVWRRGRMSRFYRQFIVEGDLCFDLGAHVGSRVGAWRRLGARVIAVEPQPNCLKVLRFLYGGDSAIEIVATAVGTSRGRTVLYASSATPTVSTTAADWVTEVKEGDSRFASIRWDARVGVAVATLDDLIARYGKPKFCKIDVEGSELTVLRGLSHALPALSFEFLPVSIERTFACIDHLVSLGAYRFRWSEAETMRWSCPHWVDRDGMKAILAARPLEGCSGDVYALRAK